MMSNHFMSQPMDEMTRFGFLDAMMRAASTETEVKKDPDMSYPMPKSMDPDVWVKLMNGMMSGQFQG
jgi:hypothetical protein